jgi:hypothetical protein
MMSLADIDDGPLACVVLFLDDPVDVIRFSQASKKLYQLVDTTKEIWENLDAQLKECGKPNSSTARDRVLRFASGRVYAKRMEALAPAHRAMLLDQACRGCTAFPNADGYWDEENEDRDGKNKMFVRMNLPDRLLFEGFLKHFYGSNGDISLYHGENLDSDFSKELDWPELDELLAYPPPLGAHGYPDQDDIAYHREKEVIAKKVFEDLTITVVLVKENINDRKLCISTTGLDKDKLGPSGYCGQYHMEIMPKVSHGIVPVEPLVEPYHFHKYYRTTEEAESVSGEFIALGHYFLPSYNREDPRVFLPMKYTGPIFGGFEPRED